ncbi:response regulator transcription factor [Streptomyces sp. RKAG293]|uniref:response regulator n=1 Tax=Streptomyces sp. RKAG293 TaxID=2893403 RepID=UPI0020345F6A|nr:response regulator transcription factor [Streptomyces sp. RKAG293]MCM2420593.1 response regulator transcription factor [Streptomyces sp. RKAG293]
MNVSVVLVDDDELARTGLRTLLTARGLTVLADVADGTQALATVSAHRPDVVLMDIQMPGLDGIKATRLLRAELADPPRIIMVTTFENDENVYDALLAGADGFVLKRTPSQQIADAVRTIAKGEVMLFPDAVRRLVGAHARPVRQADAKLTERELGVLQLMATGRTNREIAETLVVSLETVKTHVSSVLTKLNAANRTHAVVLAYEHGHVIPGHSDR